jgi:hypothetical protein
VLVAEGVAFAGGVGADPVCFGAGVGFGLPGAGDLGVGAPGGLGSVVTFAQAAGGVGLRCGDLAGCLGVGGGDLGGGVAAGLLERGRGSLGLLAGGGGGGLGGADVLAGRLQGLGQGLGPGCGLAGAGFGGDGGGLGAAPGGLGLGELGPDPGRVQAGGLVAGGPGQRGGLADYRVELGQRVGGAAGGRRSRGQDAGVVVVAAGTLGAAELPGPATVLDGQGAAAAGPLADGWRRCARYLVIGGIAGHDGTFRCWSGFSFISDRRRNEKKSSDENRSQGRAWPARHTSRPGQGFRNAVPAACPGAATAR